LKCVCERWVDDVHDEISQELCCQRRCQDDSSIFVLKDEKIDDVLFVIDVVVSAAFKDNSMKEE